MRLEDFFKFSFQNPSSFHSFRLRREEPTSSGSTGVTSQPIAVVASQSTSSKHQTAKLDGASEFSSRANITGGDNPEPRDEVVPPSKSARDNSRGSDTTYR